MQAEDRPEPGPPTRAFIVGSARSGTTWLQLLAAQHPRVASSSENHLFSRYFGHLLATFERDRLRARPRGLAVLLSREDVVGLCGTFAERLFARVLAASPGSDVLLQKCPDVEGEADLVLDVFPDARFLHVIRDPRAVVASLLAASSGWAREWAPAEAAKGARIWAHAVAAARRIPARTKAYMEVRYEALHADTAGTLAKVLAFLGLPADPEHCRRAAKACAFEDLREHRAVLRAPYDVNRHSDGFFRKGLPEGWREDLSPRDLRAVERVAWDAMRDLGYEPSSPRRPGPSASAWARRKLRHLARQLSRASARLAERLDDYREPPPEGGR